MLKVGRTPKLNPAVGAGGWGPGAAEAEGEGEAPTPPKVKTVALLLEAPKVPEPPNWKPPTARKNETTR